MTVIEVALGARSYDIIIEEGVLDDAGEPLAPFALGGRLIVVSDETVWAAQGERLCHGLRPIVASPILLPPGEASKSWETLAHLIDRLLALGIERRAHIVAFGGGVRGDLVEIGRASCRARVCQFV